MTTLEAQTFANGFLVCLLGVHVDRPRNVAEYRLSLFDGGRKVDEIVRKDAFLGSSASFLGDLRRQVVRVAAPPHVLVAYGRGWREILDLVFVPHELESFRILDLPAAAAALAPERKVTADIFAIARAFGVGLAAPVDSPLSPGHDGVLWAVIAEAGRRGLSWPELLELPRTMRSPVDFETYAFTEAWLSALPEAPAVYVMRDPSGRVVYVGKAAVLRRRVQDYFRASPQASDSLLRLRERIHSIDYHLVGSELEALLLEQRLIRDSRPEANVQRRIAEGRSRYAAPLVPVALFASSARRRSSEVFLFGETRTALQVRVSMKRPPRPTLGQVVEFFAGGRRTVRRSACLTDWGREGAEICRRYYGRCRDRLRWMEIAPASRPDQLVDAMLRIAEGFAGRPPDPAEFRFSEDA